MKLVKKVITDKMGFSTELYDMITDNGKVENLTQKELEFIHSSLKTIHEEVQFDRVLANDVVSPPRIFFSKLA